MGWQVFIFIGVIFASLSVLLQRLLLREQKSEPVAYSIFFQILTGLLIGLFGFFAADMSFPDVENLVLNLILMMVLYGFGNVFVFNALKMIEASDFTVIYASRAIFTILASSVFINESLAPLQGVGALFVLAGVAIVSMKSIRIKFRKGEIVALLAAMFFGFAVTNDRILLGSFKLYPYLFVAFVAPPLLVAAFYPSSIKKMKIFLERRTLSRMLLLCVLYAIAAIAFFTALQIGDNSSQIAAINQTAVILTVLFSILLLKERENIRRKLLGAALSFIGLVLLS